MRKIRKYAIFHPWMCRRWPTAMIIEVTPFVVVVVFIPLFFISTISIHSHFNNVCARVSPLRATHILAVYTYGRMGEGLCHFWIDFIMLVPWLPHHYFINIPLLLWLWLPLLGIKRQSHTYTHVHDKQLAEIISLIYLIVRITDIMCSVYIVCVIAYLYCYICDDIFLGINSIFHLWAHHPNQHPCVYETI